MPSGFHDIENLQRGGFDRSISMSGETTLNARSQIFTDECFITQYITKTNGSYVVHGSSFHTFSIETNEDTLSQ